MREESTVRGVHADAAGFDNPELSDRRSPAQGDRQGRKRAVEIGGRWSAGKAKNRDSRMILWRKNERVGEVEIQRDKYSVVFGATLQKMMITGSLESLL